MVYLNNEKHSPRDAISILSTARSIFHGHPVIIRDVRVARDFLEVDISIPSQYAVENMKSKLSLIAKLREIDRITEQYLNKEESIILARNLFNNEKYWKTHEVLEGIWKNTFGDEKSLLNGIILVAAALVHYQKGELAICISILKRALAKLERSYGNYHNIDIDSLKNEVAIMVKSKQITKFRI